MNSSDIPHPYPGHQALAAIVSGLGSYDYSGALSRVAVSMPPDINASLMALADMGSLSRNKVILLLCREGIDRTLDLLKPEQLAEFNKRCHVHFTQLVEESPADLASGSL